MSDPGGSQRRSRFLLAAVQVGGAWICGSVLLGTLALMVLQARTAVSPEPGSSPFRLGNLPAGLGTADLAQLTPLQRLAALLLVGLLFVALAVLGWRTAAASWLPGGTRARLLWAVFVFGGGLAGWSFAAAVTFAAQFGPGAQLVLAYLAGGLPFGLAAAMLLRSWQVNLAAAGTSAVLIVAGLVMIAGHPSPVVPQL
jgi:hypothetical protein